MSCTNLMFSIDGGVDMGWAVWEWDHSYRNELVPPLAAGVISPPTSKEWMVRVEAMSNDLKRVVDGYHGVAGRRVVEAVCEWPEYFDSAGGRTAAKQGSLVKLTFAIGVIASVFWDRGITFNAVEVHQWKGQTSKATIERRIRRRLGDDSCGKLGLDEHSWDAVGVGLWRKGCL